MVNQLTTGTVNYSHDDFGNLASAQYENGEMDYKLPDEVGNLYRTEKRKDREYGPGGQLLRAGDNRYHYDEEGNLIEKETPKGSWQYYWYGNGMLKSVLRPDGKTVDFEYDALGRRTAKIFQDNVSLWKEMPEGQRENTIPKRQNEDGIITRFIWDGNVPLHEWTYNLKDRPNLVVDELGFLVKDKEEPTSKLTTWIFDEGTFKPAAKIVDGEQHSIITDYLGTPVEMYNSQGEKTWQAEYDIYGKIRTFKGHSLNVCPFRYQGQYEDVETGLYYNRFRYYSANVGVYISKDLLRFCSKNPNSYSYVRDCTNFLDPVGLTEVTRTMGKVEMGKTVDNKGLVRGQNNSRGAKWVSKGVDPYDTAKNSDHKVVFDMDDSVDDFLKKDNLDYEDMVGGEKNNTNSILTKSNEKGAFGIGVDKLDKFNSKIKTITVYKKEKGKWKKVKTIKCK